ncbi:MAG: serine/threonine-protein kinase [Pseudomonadota bacterium]
MLAYVDGRPYEVVRRVEGGMGVVFFLQSPRPSGSLVYRDALAAKCFKSQVSEELIRRELNLWLSLSHSNILPLLAIATLDDELAALSPWRRNGTLADIGRVQHPARLKELLADVSRGLSYAWGRGILHLDIKPSNLLLTADGRVEVGDWGIARLASELALGKDSPRAYVGGTLPFMAPERFNVGPTGPACDIFSVAMTAFQLISGRLPFRRLDDSLPTQICAGGYLDTVLEACEGVWASWKPFFAACLAVSPTKRPRDYTSFDALLQSV